MLPKVYQPNGKGTNFDGRSTGGTEITQKLMEGHPGDQKLTEFSRRSFLAALKGDERSPGHTES